MMGTTCRLVLDSNTERQTAHRFYHLHGLTIRSFHFVKDLTDSTRGPAAGAAVGGGGLLHDGRLYGRKSLPGLQRRRV